MNNWTLTVLSLGILLLILLLFKEYKRENKARLWWRIIATVIAITGFICLILPVSYMSLQSEKNTNIILLTPGYDDTAVRNFLSVNQSEQVYSTEADLQVSNKFKATIINDINTLLRNDTEVAIHVFGYGLPAETLEIFHNQSFIFHPSKLPQGISAIHWPAKLKTGETIRVQGYYNNTLSKPVSITLSSFNKVLDSVIIPAASHAPFDVNTIPHQLGRSVYQIKVHLGKDTLSQESIPLEIERPRLLKVLLLSSHPDFENKFLKNWLAEQGHSVAVKTVISANKFNSGFYNTPGAMENRLTVGFLKTFDVVKADAGWFNTVTKSEAALILNAVAANKLGLIVTADSVSRNPFSNQFPLAVTGSSLQQAILKTHDSSAVLKPLKMETPLYLKPQNTLQSLITDQVGRVYAGNMLYGSGKLLYTTVTNSFNWSLAGHQNDYAFFWTMLLQKVAPAKQTEEAWSIRPFLPITDHPVKVEVQSGQPVQTSAYLNDVTVYLKNDHTISNSWNGNYWPSKKGWQSLVQFNGETRWWYNYEQGNWKTITQFDRLQATTRYALSNKNKTDDLLNITKKVPVAVPGIYFFLIILMAAAWLWYEKKLSL
ncbi:MAG: hypothetical protein V4717_03755 [Bacteroidota bacterium]